MEQLGEALEYQKEKGGSSARILTAKGILSRKLIKALAAQQKLPILPLAVQAHAGGPPPCRSVAKRHHVVPLTLEDTDAHGGLSDPMDIMALDELRMITGMDIKIGLATLSEIDRTLERIVHHPGVPGRRDLSDGRRGRRPGPRPGGRRGRTPTTPPSSARERVLRNAVGRASDILSSPSRGTPAYGTASTDSSSAPWISRGTSTPPWCRG